MQNCSGVEVLVLNEEAFKMPFLYPFHLLGWDFATMKINEDVKFFWFIWYFQWCYLRRFCVFYTDYPRWSCFLKCCYIMTFEKLLTLCWQMKILKLIYCPHQWGILKWRYFSGWCLDIYSFYRELDCWSGNIFWSLSWPLCFIAGCLQRQTDIISTHLGEFKDDSELLRATLLNVTEGVTMISHVGYWLHLPKLVLILFLWLFWCVSLCTLSEMSRKTGTFSNHSLSETSIPGTVIEIRWMSCKIFACNCSLRWWDNRADISCIEVYIPSASVFWKS